MSRTQYEVRVSGRMSERAQHAFGDYCDIRIVPAPPETIIYVGVVDQAHLQGILHLLANLGLTLVSLNQLPNMENQ
ncbi:MAG TPA: hypothetical protein VJT49_32005 [Amycolatopsis sp.]|uniref:hypothetical protein n=1 Tax=Amycolatopsis sp. TaxID=37632 RepID=UPI002B487AD3|nr:hypothetical protein [Amycolatopsis sp.]HKS49656.1 hypothetical protein [Amycolatopsis sp.]